MCPSCTAPGRAHKQSPCFCAGLRPCTLGMPVPAPQGTNETRRQPAAWWGAYQAAGPFPSPCLLELGIFCFHLSRPTTLGVFPLSRRLIHRFIGHSCLARAGEQASAKKRREHQRRPGSPLPFCPEGRPALLRLQARPTPLPRALSWAPVQTPFSQEAVALAQVPSSFTGRSSSLWLPAGELCCPRSLGMATIPASPSMPFPHTGNW